MPRRSSRLAVLTTCVLSVVAGVHAECDGNGLKEDELTLSPVRSPTKLISLELPMFGQLA